MASSIDYSLGKSILGHRGLLQDCAGVLEALWVGLMSNNSSAEIASLHRFIHLAIDILLNSSDGVFHTLSLRTCEAKLVHNGNCLSCKTKGKGLYLLVSCFPVEARQAEVSVPLGPPCFEVGAPVHLQVEFWQVPLPKREQHSSGSGHSSDWKENCSQRHVKTQSHKKVMCQNSHVIQ